MRAERSQPPNGNAGGWGLLALIYYLELQGKKEARRGQAAPPIKLGRAGLGGRQED